MRDLTSFQVSFRTWLALLSAVSSLPMILFAIASLAVLVENQQYDEKQKLDRAAIVLSRDMERLLSSRAGVLVAIADTDSARADDMAAIYDHAARLVAGNPALHAIDLIDKDGRILFSTLEPYGKKLPDTTHRASAVEVIETKRPHVSEAFYGVISRAQVAALGVPLFVGNTVRYCLRGIIPVRDLNRVLRQQYFPPNWSAALMAGNTPIAVYGPLYAKNNQDTAASDTEERIVTTVMEVGRWGWHVSVSVPERAFVRPLRSLLFKFGAVGFACALLGMAASQLLSRRLGREITELASASAALSSGETAFDEKTIIREMGEVRACLMAAKDREEQAMNDQLTGLPGRGRFWMLAGLLESRCRKDVDLGLALMFIDLDGFKQINDEYGHDRGDDILRGVADILRESVRDTDVVGRMGGDEFAVCLSAGNEHLFTAATTIAERIVGRVDALGSGIGCSIGIILCRTCPPDLPEALRLADQAMYEAKRLGKNRYTIREYTPA